MREPPSIAWLLLLLTGVVTFVALTPKLRRGCRWGRTSTSVPMSMLGLLGWIAAFAIMTASAFGWIPFACIFLPLPILSCAALYDSWRSSKKRAEKGVASKR